MLIVLSVVGGTCVFLPQCNRLRELQKKRVDFRQKTRRTEMLTRELRLKQERFDSDPAFVVRTARETGMIMPDETVFKLTNAPVAGNNPAP
jgi:cell division protein FtsB